MNGYIANTDYGWYKFLHERKDLEEVNFWRPSNIQNFHSLLTGEPLFFKLKSKFGNPVVGFGIFYMYQVATFFEAWETFQESNGASSSDEMWKRLSQYVNNPFISPYTHKIGCILLSQPTFFPEELWIDGPKDWHNNIVSGTRCDLLSGEGLRIWTQCLKNAELLNRSYEIIYKINEPQERYGPGTMVKPRLGQGLFSAALKQIYQKCAVTNEHSLPALEAAHIRPYKAGGTHDIQNGILLRADIHRLFDKGFVTISPDYQFLVSKCLERDYNNGKVYYAFDNQKIWVPDNSELKPNKDYLDYHMQNVFIK